MSKRPRITAIAAPILGEFMLGLVVAMVGLWLASAESVAEAGAFSLSNQVLETLFVLFRVLAIGVGVTITQAAGGAQPETARRTALAGLGAGTWLGLTAALWLLFGNELTLDLLNTPDKVRPHAEPFLQLLAPAALLDAFNLTMASILRANLHARDSLHVMLVMHATHLLLAVPLMRGVGAWEGFGLPGYAYALLASRAIGLALHLWLWRRRMQLVPTRHDWWTLDRAALWPVFRIGVPAAALEMAYRLAFMVSLASGARLGVEALAAQAYTLQLQRLVLLISLSIGWACEIMVGRLVGAGQLRSAERLVKKALRNGIIASTLCAIVAAAGAPWIMRIFTRDATVIHLCQILLVIAIALEAGRVFNILYIGVLRATGDAVFPVAASIASIVFVLGFGSYFLSRWIGLPGIWIAYAADEWIRGLIMGWRWRHHGWLSHARATRRRLRLAT